VRPRADPAAQAAWTRIVLWQGALALALVLALRLEKAAALGIDPGGPGGWLRFVLPDLGFVLLFESLWLLAGPAPGLRWALAAAHVAVLGLTALAHSFLLITGHRLEAGLAAYAVRHFGILREIFFMVADGAVATRLAAALLAALAPLALPRRRVGPRAPAALRWSALALGLLVLLAPAGPRQPALAGSDVWTFFTGGRRLVPDPAAARHVVAPAAFYQPPVLTSAPTRRPNLILLLLESTGAGAVATEGAAPALARLAAEGVTVEAAYASVSHTSKALVGILCGVPPRSTMDIVESLEGNLPIPCLPRLLAEAGYRTVFLQTAAAVFENRPGLVRNLGFVEGAYRETLERPGFERLGYFGLDDRGMLEPALDWIAAAGGEPYFMTLLTSAPHHPYQTPGAALGDALADPRAAYRRAIAAQDRLLEDLVSALAARGTLEQTVLIVLGDHGEAFGEHQRQQHDAVPYEEVVRVPWVFYGPAILGAPRRIAGLRHHVDLLPTVLGLLGIEWRGTLPGRDLLSAPGHDFVVSSCWWANTCLAGRSGDVKLVYHYGRRPLESFDLARDPAERGGAPVTLPAEELRELEARLLAHRLSVDRFWAQFPVAEGEETWWAEDLKAGREGRDPAARAPARSR
jgi:hypothetical protein